MLLRHAAAGCTRATPAALHAGVGRANTAARCACTQVQVLIRRELEEAAKVLGERVRTGEATSEVRVGCWVCLVCLVCGGG